MSKYKQTKSKSNNSRLTPVQVSAPEHGIDPDSISAGAMTIVRELHDAGYEGLLVGGCVRDLLLGGHPKDYDVVTDARPEQIAKIFKKVRLIGRRFRLAHVRIGREIIEVSTYRAHRGDDDFTEDSHSALGRLLSDNIYGSREEDVVRRDFTVNALFYDCVDDVVFDYLGGLDDIRQRILRIIGDPVARIKEDPVRLLRAVRFAAKLDFKFHPDTEAALRPMAFHLEEVPRARLYEEVLKLFHNGRALKTFKMLREYELFEPLFPHTYELLEEDYEGKRQHFIELAMENTDRRVAQDKPVIPAYLFAVLLWPPVREGWIDYQAQGKNDFEALRDAAHDVIMEQVGRVAIPRRVSIPVREIWDLHRRLQNIRPRNVERLMAHKRFRAAYDFCLLRAQAGEISSDAGDWWTRFQNEDPAGRKRMLRELGRSSKTGHRPRRRRHPNARLAN